MRLPATTTMMFILQHHIAWNISVALHNQLGIERVLANISVCVTTPPQYRRNGTVHAAGASILLPARVVYSVWWAWWITTGLCHAFPWCCHSNATRVTIANPPSSAQLGGIPYHSPKLHLDLCNSVGLRPRTDRHTDTDARDHNTFLVVTQNVTITIAFTVSTVTSVSQFHTQEPLGFLKQFLQVRCHSCHPSMSKHQTQPNYSYM